MSKLKTQINFQWQGWETKIQLKERILLIGSCFADVMHQNFFQNGFSVLSNPTGILFNPISIAHTLKRFLNNKKFEEGDLFFHNELWQSWDVHSQYAHINLDDCLNTINNQIDASHHFLVSTDWIFITLGSSFQYFLKEGNRPVANNHRAPAQWFDKRMLSITEMQEFYTKLIKDIQAVNPKVKIVFTISPVRHIREGIIENNRSKARLIELVHALINDNGHLHYFPAYELMIDVLRDYRYYDIDMVHPNYLGSQLVWDFFQEHCITEADYPVMEKVKQIFISSRHRSRFPTTQAHQLFLKDQRIKIKELLSAYPFLPIEEWVHQFS